MKTILIIALGILAIFIFVQAYVAKSTNDTEQQEYEVLETEGSFEIRYYPSATLASIEVGGDFRGASGKGFRILASYIFGSNSEEKKIAMTAPVHMQEGDSGYAMSFVMPSGYDTSNLPLPENASILIHNSEPAYMATIRFGGFASDEKVEAQKQQLKEWLISRGISFQEPFTYLGYNPPYQMANRRNEVMVKINYNDR
jgi:hypothetical protein